ncbi:hypothetical protein [Agrobacterium cavarae]|uniref:hypothetical protein n=1 Tax=Agrobacterium cavarae TaxID=2528239 RepID=UPI0028A0A235|nr:hypothetical protein [Agrobacterium cavarae]
MSSKYNSVHTALHTIFGAAISVAIGYAVKFDNLSDITAPLFALIFSVTVGVAAEVARTRIIDNKNPSIEIIMALLTVFLFLAAKADVMSFSDSGVFNFKPDPSSSFISAILIMWMGCLALTALVQRADV